MKIHGATYHDNGQCSFCVWAPLKHSMQLQIVHPFEAMLDMEKDDAGYFNVLLENASPGMQYYFIPDGTQPLPDPASYYQPEGITGPSEIVDHNIFHWQDEGWKGVPFEQLIMYEMHIGTYTQRGTFEAAAIALDDLTDLGINAVSLMPVAQFPGLRNWGYDGVFPYAVQHSYGGPEGLKTLVDACHRRGIAVFLDVVYNHIGPEGNVLWQYGPYFTEHYKTPWGDAINYDGEYCDGVREYFLGNMLYWFTHYHIDGLRVDAIHAIYDTGAVHFWEYAHEHIVLQEQSSGRPLYLIAESDLNDTKVIRDTETGGYAFDAQWLDDFHHSLYTVLHEAGRKRYPDFGTMEQLAKAFKEGFVHSGDYVAFRKKKYGRSSAGIPGNRFVAFIQNHDQVGNSDSGHRLSSVIDHDKLKLAAAAVLLSPYIPMLFMGEEYGADTVFLYFINHTDEQLIQTVREGRKKEFEKFNWAGNPPDPQSEATFQHSKLRREERDEGAHKLLLNWYRTLISFRKSNTVMQCFKKESIQVNVLSETMLAMLRSDESGSNYLYCVFNFSAQDATVVLPSAVQEWERTLCSKEKEVKVLQPEQLLRDTEITIPGTSLCIYTGIKRLA